jgi:DNA-directed RNA polymerase specialized sigma24 family protein
MSDSGSRSDRELFGAASSGDAQALAELAGRHARGLYDFALRGTLDEQQAEAVIQAVFRRVRDANTEVPRQIEFRTWLYSLGLVEVLAVSNETRTARISTDDERFFQRTTQVDPEVAHWAWQAARGLRTRDYCVLDLTLRRGLTPEEVAEAASLTRSNLYASIGRARGAFEETFAAMLLFEHGREACNELDELVESAPGTTLRPALRHQIIEHSDDCDACRRTLDKLPLAADVYISLANIEMPESLVRQLLGGAATLDAVNEPAEPATPEGAQPVTATAAAFAAGAAALELTDASKNEDAWDDEDGEDEGLEFELEDVADDDEFDDEFVEEEEEGELAENVEAEEDEDAAIDRPPEKEPEVAATGVAVSEAVGPAPVAAPVTPVRREAPVYVYEEGFGDRVAGWVERARGQPLMLTYAALGVLAVIAIYLGIAVADSLQSGGGDSGAVPLDSPPGVTSGRIIDCGDTPIEMDAGTSTLISFDAEALDGYEINSVLINPVSNDAGDDELEATREDGFSIRFTAAPQDAVPQRTEEFEMLLQWQRDSEAARSSCKVLVHVESTP